MGIQNKINGLSSHSWNKDAYTAVKMEIQQAENATPKPLLKSKDAKELKDLLQTTYFNAVLKEVKRFCSSEAVTNIGYGELKSQIQSEFPSNYNSSYRDKMTTALDLFAQAGSLPNKVTAYTTTQLCNNGTTGMYNGQIATVLSNEYTGSNTNIQSILNPLKTTLQLHSSLEVQIRKFFNDYYKQDLERAKKAACGLANQSNYRVFKAYTQKYCRN